MPSPEELAAYEEWLRRTGGGTTLPDTGSSTVAAEVSPPASAATPLTVADYDEWESRQHNASIAPQPTVTRVPDPFDLRSFTPERADQPTEPSPRGQELGAADFPNLNIPREPLTTGQKLGRLGRAVLGASDILSSPFDAGTQAVRQFAAHALATSPLSFLSPTPPRVPLRPEAGLFERLVETERQEPLVSQLIGGALTDPTLLIGPGAVRLGGRAAAGATAAAREAVPLARPVGKALAASSREVDAASARFELLSGQFEQASQRLDEAKAELEATLARGRPAPKFGTAERAEFDVERRGKVSKAEQVRRARVNLRTAREETAGIQRDMEEANAELDRVLMEPVTEPIAPESRLVPPSTEPTPTAGAVQAGMGIGERPPQATLGLGGEIEARPPKPLIEAGQVAERQRLAAEKAAGQQALPEARVVTPQAAEAAPPATKVVPPRQPVMESGTGEILAQGRLPSGRIPGTARAEPLGAGPPPRPPVELPPPEGGLPSGRVPGKGGIPPTPRDPYEAVKVALEPEREPFIDRIRRSLPHEFYDRNYALRDLQKRTGVAAHDLTKIVPGAEASGEDIIRQSYLPLLKGIEQDIPQLERLMVLKRMEDILTLHPGSRLPGGLTGFSDVLGAEKTLAAQVGPERFQRLENVTAELWQNNVEHVLQPLLEEGIISQDQYLAMKTGHPHYIPFQRADFVDIIDRSFGSRAEANLSSTGIKNLTVEGSERALDKPLLRLVSEPIKAQNIIFRNRAAKSIVEALEVLQKQTGEALVEYIEPRRSMNLAEQVTGERLPRAFKAEHSGLRDTISFYQNGIKHIVEVPAPYGQIAKGLSAEPDNIVLKVISVLNAPLRKGAVDINPLFTPVNIMRDAMSAIFREKVFPFGPDYMAGLWAAIRKDSLFEEAAKEGALLSGIVDSMKSPTVLPRPPLGSITLQNVSDAALLLPRLLVSVPRSISGINVVAERGVRLGTYRQLRREGVPALEAAVRARDVTVDFAQAGHTMRVVNQIIPFSNAALQGSALLVRTIREHPARSAVFASFAAATAMTERLNNMRFETSEDIPDYEYTRNWILQFGEGTRKDGSKFPIYARVPKGEIVGSFTFPVEAMFNLARKTEDRSAAELLLSAGLEQAKVMSPIDPQILPPVPIIQSAAGIVTGVDPYTKQPIIPRREQNLLPEQQYGPETSATAIALGQAAKVSPRLIDFGIKDYLAGAGTTSNWLISAGLEAVGWRRPAQYGEAFKKPALEGAEAASKTPAGRFLGTRGTQQQRRGWDEFQAVVETTNRQFRQIPDMDRLGISLGQVGDSIDHVELSPRQRASYQKEYADLVIPRVGQLLLAGTDAYKRDRVREMLDEARSQARRKIKIK